MTAGDKHITRSPLFVQGWVKLHSGSTSRWKIECDALTDDDLDCLALMVTEIVPLFGAVEGVPTGALRLAAALEHYATPGIDRLLIVDDVCTSGGSMEEHRAGRDAIGAVLFARGPYPSWVTPLFAMPAGAVGDVTPPPDARRDLSETLEAVIDAIDAEFVARPLRAASIVAQDYDNRLRELRSLARWCLARGLVLPEPQDS